MKQNEDIRDAEQVQETQEQVDAQDTQELEPVSEATDAAKETDGAEESETKRIPRKRVAIACGVAVALIAGVGVAWAAGLFNAEEEATPTQTTVTNTYEAEDDAIVEGEATVVLTPIAEGFDEESSPFIAHITGETATGEEVDFYHAVWADGSTSEVTLEQGDYEITWTSAVNSDGSIYDTTDVVTTLAVSAEDVKAANEATEASASATATDDDEEAVDTDEDTSSVSTSAATDTSSSTVSATTEKAIEVEQEFDLIDAADVTDGELTQIMEDVSEAVGNGDETLTGDNGTTVAEIVERNIAVNDNTDDDAIEENADETSEETSSSSSGSSTSSRSSSSNSSSSSSNNNATSSSSSSSNSSSSSSSNKSSENTSSSSNSSSSSSNSSSSSDNSTNSSSNNSNSSNSSSSTHNHSWTSVSTCWECKGCGAQFSDVTEVFNHIKSTSCGSYCVKYNYTCSCGASKVDW